MNAKKWYLSRSLWLGVIAIATAIITSVEAGASWEKIALAAFGASAVLLRTQTELPLGK